MSEVRIRIDDVRAAGYCSSGAKRWFALHDLDFRDFLKNGISEKDFLATGDACAEHIVKHRKARYEQRH